MTHDLQIWLRDKMMEDAKKSRLRVIAALHNTREERRPHGEIITAIMAALSNGPCSPAEVRDRIGMDTARTTVTGALSRLTRTGVLNRIPGAVTRYEIARPAQCA